MVVIRKIKFIGTWPLTRAETCLILGDANRRALYALTRRAYLLADLIAFELDSVVLRQIPLTEALREQKIRSLDSVASWWLERLISGSTSHHENVWQQTIIRASLYDDYIKLSDRVGVRRKRDSVSFGIELRKLVPGIGDKRPLIGAIAPDGTVEESKRHWCYVLPPLEECRAAFEQQMGQRVDWPVEESAEGADAAF
jgi:hypothetical protein